MSSSSIPPIRKRNWTDEGFLAPNTLVNGRLRVDLWTWVPFIFNCPFDTASCWVVRAWDGLIDTISFNLGGVQWMNGHEWKWVENYYIYIYIYWFKQIKLPLVLGTYYHSNWTENGPFQNVSRGCSAVLSNVRAKHTPITEFSSLPCRKHKHTNMFFTCLYQNKRFFFFPYQKKTVNS